MKAVVYKSTGSWYRIKTADNQFLDARIRGRFKTDNLTSTNPLAVGDSVEIETDETGAVMIDQIDERRNYIIRQSPQNKNLQHIIAANIDQSILIASLKNPRTSTGFIDRFLVACEAFHIPAAIIFNKADTYKEKENLQFEKIKSIYEKIGYPVYLVSVYEKTGLSAIDQLLSKKKSLVSGHSGVGKSSFINLFLPDHEIKTREVSGWSGKGMHTTTFSEMYDLAEGGAVIDTPGMREFALKEIEPEELSHYFADMRPLIGGCKFNNCLHVDEPECAIKKAVAEGEIEIDRYVSYLNILASLKEKKW